MESHLTLKTVSDLTLASSMTLRLFPEIRKVDHIINRVKSETIMIMSALCLTNTLNWILLCRLTETTVYRLDMSVPITTDVVVLTPAQGEEYNIM
jgi:hypothetical protein